MLLLPTTYFGNIEYFSTLISGDKIVIEAHESYKKQTYRNRCLIMTANGVIPIIVPIKHNKGEKIEMCDVLIDDSMPWQRNAWRAIVSTYRNSPFFDHYESLIEPLFSKRYDSLMEMNNRAMEATLKALYASPDLHYTTKYINKKDITEGMIDLRDEFTPKKTTTEKIYSPYYQVFSDRMSFEPNLSIMDLLFCEGPNATNILKR